MSNYKTGRVIRNRPFSFFWIILLLVAGGIAYGAATLWENGMANPEPQTSSSSMTEPATSSSEPEDSSSEPQPSQSSESQSESETKPAAVFGEAVPKGDWAPASYFDDALLVGDSITYGVQVYNTMSNVTVIAHTGINPETILSKEVIRTPEGTVTVLEAMKQHKPGKIYIMMGANGVAFIGKDKMMGYYGEFIDKVKAQHPESIVYVQSILPVTAEKSKDERYSNERITEYNLALMALAKEKQVYYLNVAEAFQDETGALPTEASPKDGMHFGPEYYMKWFDYLKTHTVEGGTK